MFKRLIDNLSQTIVRASQPPACPHSFSLPSRDIESESSLLDCAACGRSLGDRQGIVSRCPSFRSWVDAQIEESVGR